MSSYENAGPPWLERGEAVELRYDIAELIADSATMFELREKLKENYGEDPSKFVACKDKRLQYTVKALCTSLPADSNDKERYDLLEMRLPTWFYEAIKKKFSSKGSPD